MAFSRSSVGLSRFYLDSSNVWIYRISQCSLWDSALQRLLDAAARQLRDIFSAIPSVTMLTSVNKCHLPTLTPSSPPCTNHRITRVEQLESLRSLASHELNWGPCIHRYFDFHSKWKMQYDYPFSFSNSNLFSHAAASLRAPLDSDHDFDLWSWHSNRPIEGQGKPASQISNV